MQRILWLCGCLSLWLCLTISLASGEESKAIPPPRKGAIWAEDADEWVVEPYAGNYTAGAFIQGAAPMAGFGSYAFGEGVNGMGFDKEGNAYIATATCVARVDTGGRLRFLAGLPGIMGYRDGQAERALFSSIQALCVGPKGQIYLLDRGNLCIRQLIKKDGRWLVETVAGTPGKSEIKNGPAQEASFGDPCNLAVNSQGELFTFDKNQIRKIAGGRVETVPVDAKFNLIMGAGCCFDDKDNLYVADRWNFSVRKVDLKTGKVEDVIGETGKSGATKDGPAREARFHDSPGYVIFDPVRQCLYTNGVDESFVRRYKDGWVKTLAGGGQRRQWFGPAKGVIIGHSRIVAVDKQGDLYHADSLFMGVRKIRHVGKVQAQAIR